MLKLVPLATVLVTLSTPQLSLVAGASQLTTAKGSVAAALISMGSGQVMVGLLMSCTVTAKVHVPALPAASVAVAVTYTRIIIRSANPTQQSVASYRRGGSDTKAGARNLAEDRVKLTIDVVRRRGSCPGCRAACTGCVHLHISWAADHWSLGIRDRDGKAARSSVVACIRGKVGYCGWTERSL